MNKKQTIDLTYRQIDSMFTTFYPETKEGVNAWNVIAAKEGGVAKIFNKDVKNVLEQLRKAGYTVKAYKKATTKGSDVKNCEDLFNALLT